MDDEFVRTAESILRRSPTGTDALHELEWVPSLDLTDEYSAESFSALFRAQGRSLATTPALAVLIAHQLGVTEGPQDLGTTASYQARRHGERVAATLSRACIQADRIVVDIGEETLFVGSPAAFSEDGTQPLDPSCVNMTAAISALGPVTVDDIGGRRVEAQRVARLACALEMLGVCEHLMQLAVSYAIDRTQFGAPIGSFPALQQLLAAAEVDVVGLRNGCVVVMGEQVRAHDPEPRHDAMLVKALAGRVSRRVTQATLQVLGAVGFTWEHDHHRYQRRALTLDALFGSYHELVTVLCAVPTDAPLRRVGVM
jgi:Acyl-CoA dehydrogenase, C-terminal domain